VNSILNIFLDQKDQIRCKPQGEVESLWFGDLRIFASDDQLEAIRGAIELRLHQKRHWGAFDKAPIPPPDPFVARWGTEVDRELTEALDLYPDHTVATIDPDEILADMAQSYEVHREV
jgi:hypothetical protein